jgi:hypothetical protein
MRTALRFPAYRVFKEFFLNVCTLYAGNRRAVRICPQTTQEPPDRGRRGAAPSSRMTECDLVLACPTTRQIIDERR